MTTTEKELDQNTNFDWNRIQESGKEVEPFYGPGPNSPFCREAKGQLAKINVDTTVLGLSDHEALKNPYIASMGVYVFRRCRAKGSRLDEGVELKDAMMIGADYYQTDSTIAAMLASGRVPIGVGQNTKITNCIFDKNAKIGKNVVIANKDNMEEADRSDEGF
ncbi:glucose-1-phosphate adenylyltransferase large subunit 2, chloroplastic/amyloplastic [Tanacetum coccineum]